MKTLFGLFLLVHGLIHAAIWLPPTTAKAPFDPKHSWLLDGMGLPPNLIHAFAIMLGLVAALAFIGGGIGLFAHLDWWKISVFIGSFVSLVLLVTYFNPWFSLAFLLNLSIIYLIAIRHWPITK